MDVRRHPAQTRPPFLGYYRQLLAATRGADVVHAHLHGPADLALLGIFAHTCRRVILTIHAHNVAGRTIEGQAVRRGVVRNALRAMAGVICVSDSLVEEALALGVLRERILMAPAFLPPDCESFMAMPLDPAVAALVARFPTLLSANAFQFSEYEGRLLYGQDLLVRLIATLAPAHPTVGLVVHVSRVEGAGLVHFERVRALARALGVEERIVWITGSQPFGPSLVRSRVMLRPTLTDGDAVSVREALHCGVAVVASDVVERPVGTRLAGIDDVDAWGEAVADALRSDEGGPRYPQADPLDAIMDFYRTSVLGA